jgi:hypothetical protein
VTDSLETESTTTVPKAPPANTTAQVTAQAPVQSKPPETKVV